MDEITAHLNHLAWLNRRPSSIQQRGYFLAKLVRHTGPDILTLDRDDLARFVARPGRGAEARAAEVSHLRAFYRWAILEELVSTDPTVGLHRPRLPRRLPRPMPDADVARAFAGAPERVVPWLYLAAYAGLRACEIAPLRGDDIDHSRGVIRIREQKGGSEGAVPLAPILCPILEVLPAFGWLFPHRGRGPAGPITPNQLQGVANRALRGLGIGHTLHTLRHWFATNVYRQSAQDIRLTQELMRHRSLAATAIYTAIDSPKASRVVALLPVLAVTAVAAA